MAHACRQLTALDLGLMRQLLLVFGAAFGEPEAYGGAAPSEAYWRRVLAKPDVIALVAESDGCVVGGLVAYVLEKLEQERKEIYIYDLAVAEPYRRQGIARELIALLRRLGKERGAHVIYVQADRVDEPAIRLYRSLGVGQEVLHFDFPVE